MTKKIIRKNIKDMRLGMDYNDYEKFSDNIFEKIISLEEYKNAKVIYLYMNANNEVSTKNLIMHAFRQGKEIAIPKIEDGVMNFYLISSPDNVKPGYFGILEPTENTIPNTPDIVIVPGVAFSLDKDRLGYGGGFYDRFLDEKVLKIALAFEFQILESIPTKEHDIKMDMIITEKRIIG